MTLEQALLAALSSLLAALGFLVRHILGLHAEIRRLNEARVDEMRAGGEVVARLATRLAEASDQLESKDGADDERPQRGDRGRQQRNR